MERVSTESSTLNREALEKITNLQKEIITEIIANNDSKKRFVANTEDSDEAINYLLKNNGELSLVQQTHKFLIFQIVYRKFFNERFEIAELAKYFTFASELDISKFPSNINIHSVINSLRESEIPELLESLHLYFLNTYNIKGDHIYKYFYFVAT